MRRTKTQLMGELLEEFFRRPYIAAKVAEGHLPDVWREGTIEGIRCRGGFVVEKMNWEEGRLTSVTIRSTLGGMLRLRTSTPITGHALVAATAPTDNPLLQLQPILEEKISPEAPAPTTTIADYLEYDLVTNPGKSYTFRAE